MTDRLSIAGLEVWARVGCTAEERAFPQRLELDLDLFLSLARAGTRDDLEATVDYADVAAKVKRTLEAKTCRLAETLAELAAERVLASFPVGRVAVRLRKRALPGIAWAEIAIERARGEALPAPRRKM